MEFAPNISFRESRPEDLAPLTEFLQPFVEAQQLLQRTSDELATLLKHGFVAISGTAVVGFAAVEIYSRKLAEIQALAVAPAFQRQGLGHRLVQLCVERAQREKVVELMAITASEQLFMDCGFDYSLPNQKRAVFINP